MLKIKTKRNRKLKKFFHYLISLRYVKLFSFWSARALKNKLNQSYTEKYAYYYGFQIIYGAINKFLLLILVGLLFHALPQILIATVSFMIPRVYIGGGHFDNYTKCAYVSLACLVTAGLLGKYIPYNIMINLITFIIVFIIALKYAPIEHKNRPLTNNQKVLFKFIALRLTSLIFIIQQTIINSNNINNSIIYGVLLAGLIALPIFNKNN